MPLIGKKLFQPNSPPTDLKSEEEIFIIKETDEVFRSYDEYVNRIILYGFQVWTCCVTGRTNLKHAEAMASEEQALQRLESFPKYFEKPVLQLAQHSTSKIQILAQECTKWLENEFVEDEPVKFCINEMCLQGRISKVHFSSGADMVSKDIPSTSNSPSSDKENSVVSKTTSPTTMKTNQALQAKYDVVCKDSKECYRNIPYEDIKRLKTLPSVELLQWFIRANTENPWHNDGTPLIVKNELVKKHSLFNKLSKFSVVVNQKSTPPFKGFKATPKGGMILEMPRKRSLEMENGGHAKSKVTKDDPSQMKLDSFRKASCKENEKSAVLGLSSSFTGGQSCHNKMPGEPPLKLASLNNVVDGSGKSDDCKTPHSGKMLGTPLKCKLFLTPDKLPCLSLGKNNNIGSTGNRKVEINRVNDNQLELAIASGNSTKCIKTNSTKKTGGRSNSLNVTSSESIAVNRTHEGNFDESPLKLTSAVVDVVDSFDTAEESVSDRLCRKLPGTPLKTPRSDKAKKTTSGSNGKPDGKPAVAVDCYSDSDSAVEKPQRSLKTSNTNKAGEKRETKTQVSKNDEKLEFNNKVLASRGVTELRNLFDVSTNKRVLSPTNQKLEGQFMPLNNMNSTSKLKETTPVDQAKKSVEESALLLSLKATKTKKQQTLSEMFSAAFQKDKPQVLNVCAKQTGQKMACRSHDDPTLTWNKIRDHHYRMLQPHLNVEKPWKSPKNIELNLKPLPPPKPVDMPREMSTASFGDIIMVAEFIHTFRDLLAPRKTFHFTADSLICALVSGSKGVSLLSRILVVFLEILLQDRSTKGVELGMQLSELPLTQQSAPEVTRLYLSSNVSVPTADEGKELQGIVDSLQDKEFYALHAVEKLKVLVILCHDVMSAGAMDVYIESQLLEVRELRKKKAAKQKAKKDKIREEKEKKETELTKQKEEKERKMQLKMDEMTNKDQSASKPESHANESSSLGTLIKGEGGKHVKCAKGNVKAGRKEDVPEVVKALRSQKQLKNEKTMDEEERNSRLEREDEEQLNVNITRFQHSLRLKPVGYDRNHARYWVLPNALAGVYVERGWNDFSGYASKDETTCVETQHSSQKVETEEHENEILDVEMKTNATQNGESVFGSLEKDGFLNERLSCSVTDIPGKWSCYDTVEGVQELLRCLSHHGKQEKLLYKALTEQMEVIAVGINKRNSSKKLPLQETNDVDLLSSLKEELTDIASSLVNGNLAVLSGTLEEYKKAVRQASSVCDLASQLEMLLPAVLPQFLQGMFSKDKKNCDSAKQRWMDEVKGASTTSRLHLLIEILDSTVIWNMSAENKPCTICHQKGLGKTLILCDDCNRGYHLHCLRPALSVIPEGHWSCPLCKDEDYSEKEEGSESSDEHEDYCNTCGEHGDLVCCDTCPLVFHKDCHQPPLRIAPRGPWSCWMCRQPKNKKLKNNKGGSVKRNKTEAKENQRVQTSQRSMRNRSGLAGLDPKEISYNDKSSRARRGKKWHSIEESSDSSGLSSKSRRTGSKHFSDLDEESDSSIDDGCSTKTRRRSRLESDSKDGRAVGRRLRNRKQVGTGDEEAVRSYRLREGGKSNVKSFYSRRRNRDVRSSKEKDSESSIESSPEHFPNHNKSSKNAAREMRSRKRQILSSSEDEQKAEPAGREMHEISRRTVARPAKKLRKTGRRTTRSLQNVRASSDESEDLRKDGTESDGDENISGRRNKRISSSLDESEESGPSKPKQTAMKRGALTKLSQETNRRSTAQGSQEDKENSEEAGNSGDGGKRTAKFRTRGQTRQPNKRSDRSNKSTVPSADRNIDRPLEEMKEKRRRSHVDMDVCERILRDLLLHDDSWPFRQAVNLREVPDYMKFVSTPMDLGTIKGKLQNVEYPDVESFVADLRLVFSNCDKYNLSSSDVGQAGISLGKYFEILLKRHFPTLEKKMKMQKKR